MTVRHRTVDDVIVPGQGRERTVGIVAVSDSTERASAAMGASVSRLRPGEDRSGIRRVVGSHADTLHDGETAVWGQQAQDLRLAAARRMRRTKLASLRIRRALANAVM